MRRIPADQSLRDQLTEDLTKTNDEHDWSGIFNCAGCPVWRRRIFERSRYVLLFLSSRKSGSGLVQLNLAQPSFTTRRHFDAETNRMNEGPNVLVTNKL